MSNQIISGSNNEIIITDALGNPMPKINRSEEIPIEERGKQLPTPTGYRILCAIPEVEKEFDSGLVKADQTVNYEEKLATVLFVVELGPDCYTDKARFPSGPWCEKGDFVVVRPNAGSRLLIHGREFRMINDDSVEAVVQDPRGIKRAY